MPNALSPSRRTDGLFLPGGNRRTTKSLPLAPGPRKSGTDSFPDHGALKLGKDTQHLKHRPSRSEPRNAVLSSSLGRILASDLAVTSSQRASALGGNSWAGMVQFVSIYGVWFVAGLIALESVGFPVPAEAALIAAAFFGARTHELDICLLISGGILAAIVGEIVGFWIGKMFGRRVLVRYRPHLGLTEGRLRLAQWLFVKYGVRFVFVARFLPFLRNMAAVLAGTNCMAQHHFYFASSAAAVAWVTCYGLGAYSFGEAFAQFASWAAFSLGSAALLIVIAVPLLILRYEKRALAKASSEIANSEIRALIESSQGKLGGAPTIQNEFNQCPQQQQLRPELSVGAV